MRLFPPGQHSYVIEFVAVCADEIQSADWQFSCSTSFKRMTETHRRLGQVNAEGNEAMKAAARQQLDPTIRSTDTRDFEGALRSKIVGQAEGVQALVDLYQVFCAGLNSPGRPVGNLLFLGPTGSGKTRIVEAAAEILFGDGRSVIKVDCAEFQHSHEIAKLIGSPPGYLGHRETHPLITQEALAASHTEKLKLSFLLFDEIEKASDALWQLLLGMLDKATLTLGDNRRVDLSQTVIFLTSNLGGGEITELMNGGMGFIQPKDKPAAGLDQKVERTAVEAARRKFSPEFMNRLDKVVVFHPLRREQLEEVLEIELGQVQQRVLETAKGQFLFRVTESGREFLLQEGTDQRYGARHLKRAIERHVVYPLANLLATEQVHLGDLVCIDWSKGNEGLSFVREGENLAMPARRSEPVATARTTQARSGKSIEAPSPAIGPDPTPRMAR
jgi:ATP-dependent Clp protease ATP-binding subunit ClpB